MLAVRLDEELEARLAALARSRGRSKSDLVRDALERYLNEDAYLAEMRRQSLLAAQADGCADVLDFAAAAQADVMGWEAADEPR